MGMRFKLISADKYFKIVEDNKRLTETLANTVSYVDGLRNGNYRQQLPPDDLPVYSSLKSLSDSLVVLEEKEKQRNWQSQGLSLFMDILKSNTSDIAVLSEKLITTLVKYLDANQGGFFTVEQQPDRESIIKLTACYAYGRKKHVLKEIQPGEGIIGQTFLEKRFVYMTKVPDGYTTITSGLGEATPGAILVVPMKYNNEVKALVELASFKPFKNYHIQFIESLGENIAAVIESNLMNRKTELLLKASQQHTEELRAQEEEMRQNVEELTAMHENQRRLQNELSSRLQELETAKQQIEQFKQAEAEKMKRQNEVQTKIMNSALEKFKKRERELLDQIAEKNKELDSLKGSFLTIAN